MAFWNWTDVTDETAFRFKTYIYPHTTNVIYIKPPSKVLWKPAIKLSITYTHCNPRTAFSYLN